MWTVLIGPVAMLLALAAGFYAFIAGYAIWLIFTRTIRSSVGWVHGRRFSPIYIPLQLGSEWAGAVIKIWVYFHPVKQTWMNRGNRTQDSSKETPLRTLRAGLANYYSIASSATFVLIVGCYLGIIPLKKEFPLLTRSLWPSSEAKEEPQKDVLQIRPGSPRMFGTDVAQAPLPTGSNEISPVEISPIRKVGFTIEYGDRR